MALTLAKIEAVKFGDFESVPKFGQEQKLRVQNLKISEDNLDEVRDTLSKCFGDDADKVKAFMEKNMFLLDYTRLQVYLTQGQSGLDNFERRMDRFMDKEMDKAAGARADE